MSLASAQVIAHRMTRMAAAGPIPGEHDRQEFTRMGQEKFDAVTESARAMTAHLTALNLEFTARALSHLVASNAALLAWAASGSVGQSILRQAELAETVSRSAKSASELLDSVAGLAGSGIAPIHARATANAKRLRRR
jgi:hypothetical protein